MSDASIHSHPDDGALMLYHGNSGAELAAKIAQHLKIKLGQSHVKRFSDGEVSVQIHDSVRGNDAFIVQSTSTPVNDNLMELILMVTAMRRASSAKITAVMPYFGYGRQDRRRLARETLAAADVAKLLETAGVDRVVSVDLHVGQVEGFFSPNVPVDNLDALAAVIPYILSKDLVDPVIVSPSANGVNRAKKFRGAFLKASIDARMAFLIAQNSDGIHDLENDPHHSVVDRSETMGLVGEVSNSDAIIVDDMIDTGSRVTATAAVLKQHGARRVFVCATHGLLTGDAITLIENSVIEEAIITDTIPLKRPSPKIVQLSVSQILAEWIHRIHWGQSVSELFTTTS